MPGAETAESEPERRLPDFSNVTHAAAHLSPASGSDVAGEILFIEKDGAVEIRPEIQGLDPNSIHAIHIHEYGDCTAPDGSSAGGHFNPTQDPHGAPYSQKHHAGDLGNIVADSRGRVTGLIRADEISLGGLGNSVLGRSVVVHAKQDDFKTQPAGDAGARIACGVIGVEPSSYASGSVLAE